MKILWQISKAFLISYTIPCIFQINIHINYEGYLIYGLASSINQNFNTQNNIGKWVYRIPPPPPNKRPPNDHVFP